MDRDALDTLSDLDDEELENLVALAKSLEDPDAAAATAEVGRKHRDRSTTRRDLLKAGGAVGVGALLGGGATGVASADASDTDSDPDVGTPSNRIDVFADGVDANSATIGSTPEGRPFTTNSAPTLDAGSYADSAALATAIPKFPRHQIDITIPSGGIAYDILIPPTFGGHQRSSGTASESAAPINVNGSGTGQPAAGNYQVPSLYTESVAGKLGVGVTGVEFTSSNPYDDESAGVGAYSSNVYLTDCTFSGGTNGINSWQSNVGVNNVDFGSSVLSGNAMVAKHGGIIWEQKAATDPAQGTVGGYVFDVQVGFAFAGTNSHSITGSSGFVDRDSDHVGLVFDYENNRLYGPDESGHRWVANGFDAKGFSSLKNSGVSHVTRGPPTASELQNVSGRGMLYVDDGSTGTDSAGATVQTGDLVFAHYDGSIKTKRVVDASAL